MHKRNEWPHGCLLSSERWVVVVKADGSGRTLLQYAAKVRREPWRIHGSLTAGRLTGRARSARDAAAHF